MQTIVIDNNKNEILFFKVFHNIIIRNYIFYKIRSGNIQFYKGVLESNGVDSKYYIGNRIQFSFLNKLTWFIKKREYTLLIDKVLNDNDDSLYISKKSLYWLVEQCEDVKVYEALCQKKKIQLLSSDVDMVEISARVGNMIALDCFTRYEFPTNHQSIEGAIEMGNLHSLEYLLNNRNEVGTSSKLYDLVPWYQFDNVMDYILTNSIKFKGIEHQQIKIQTFLFTDNQSLQFKMLDTNQVEVITNLGTLQTLFSQFDIITVTPPIAQYLKSNLSSESYLVILDFFITNLKKTIDKYTTGGSKDIRIKNYISIQQMVNRRNLPNTRPEYDKYNSNFENNHYRMNTLKKRKQVNKLSNKSTNETIKTPENDSTYYELQSINEQYYLKRLHFQDLLAYGYFHQLLEHLIVHPNQWKNVKLQFKQVKKVIKYLDFETAVPFIQHFIKNSNPSDTPIVFNYRHIVSVLLQFSNKATRIDIFEYLISNYIIEPVTNIILIEEMSNQILYASKRCHLKMLNYLLSGSTSVTNSLKSQLIPVCLQLSIQKNNISQVLLLQSDKYVQFLKNTTPFDNSLIISKFRNFNFSNYFINNQTGLYNQQQNNNNQLW